MLAGIRAGLVFSHHSRLRARRSLCDEVSLCTGGPFGDVGGAGTGFRTGTTGSYSESESSELSVD
jgi:hypothetical protein